jgi:hypothetical protein
MDFIGGQIKIGLSKHKYMHFLNVKVFRLFAKSPKYASLGVNEFFVDKFGL